MPNIEELEEATTATELHGLVRRTAWVDFLQMHKQKIIYVDHPDDIRELSLDDDEMEYPDW